MDELLKRLTQQTGISEEQARQVVKTVTAFIQDKLPPPIAAQVESLLGAENASGALQQAQEVLGSLGGMFGKK